MANSVALGDTDGPGVTTLLPEDYPEECSFPVTVSSDKSHPFPRVNRKTGLDEDILLSVRFI